MWGQLLSAAFHKHILMPTYIKLATHSDLPAANEVKEIPCPIRGEGKTICLANVNGEYSALDNVCLHMGGPLGEGTIEGGKVVCPWHGWKYDPKTGATTHNPGLKVAVYPLKIENGDVLIEI
jgi:nitrite reductase (NADH) small subunit